jgi:integrase
VRDVFDVYLAAADSGQIELAPRTIVTTRSAANTMSSTRLLDGREFGRVPLSKLHWQTIEELYGEMKSAGLGTDWIRRCATVLSRALDYARKRSLIDSNPARDATRPKSTRSKPFAPTVDEVRAVLAVVRDEDDEFADAVSVLAGTGMRKAELLGLQWADVDLSHDELHVAAAITDAGPGHGVVRKSTKKSDWRDIPLSQQTRGALVRQRDRFEARWGNLDDGRTYVFPSSSGPAVPWRPDSFTDRWTALRGSSSITIQQLRHFAATVMLDAGESYRTVADLLGNSENTLRLHYDGRTDVGKRRAIAALDL